MKEEEDDDDEELDLEDDRSSPTPASMTPMNFGLAESLKRHLENNDKFAMIKSMMEKQQVNNLHPFYNNNLYQMDSSFEREREREREIEKKREHNLFRP